MIKQIAIISILNLTIQLLNAQTVDLSSVDAFFDITTTLKLGEDVSNEQWEKFDNSTVYKQFANSDDKFLIGTIKKSMFVVFENTVVNTSHIDSILSISKEEMKEDKKLLLKKLIVENYIDLNENYSNVQSFRDGYNFESIINAARYKLSTFLGHSIDSIIDLKPLHFFVLSADAKAGANAIIIDLNLFYKLTEKQRIELVAHEYFHDYRKRFENHDFNYKCDLNYTIDMIQNEGIADMIDKTEGYREYYLSEIWKSDLSPIMIQLYDSAEKDLERLHELILKYESNSITEAQMVDELLKFVKFNGHPIGFYMANQIVQAGYEKQMVSSFYNPFEFYRLYNESAKKNDLFVMSDKFMNFVFDRKE